MNTGCQEVFDQWILLRLYSLALLGFTLFVVNSLLVYTSFSCWRGLSNGAQRIMWHHSLVEFGVLSLTMLIVLAGSLLIGLFFPEAPVTFDYANEYPKSLEASSVEAIKLK